MLARLSTPVIDALGHARRGQWPCVSFPRPNTGLRCCYAGAACSAYALGAGKQDGQMNAVLASKLSAIPLLSPASFLSCVFGIPNLQSCCSITRTVHATCFGERMGVRATDRNKPPPQPKPRTLGLRLLKEAWRAHQGRAHMLQLALVASERNGEVLLAESAG